MPTKFSGQNQTKELPPNFYEKASELLEQAQNIDDPEVKKVAIDACRDYYQADLKQASPVPAWALILIVIAFYLLVFGTVVVSSTKLSWIPALTVSVVTYCFLSLLLGAVLRICGLISGSSLIAIWKAGFKIVTTLSKIKK